jgi:hypothetical protein
VCIVVFNVAWLTKSMNNISQKVAHAVNICKKLSVLMIFSPMWALPCYAHVSWTINTWDVLKTQDPRNPALPIAFHSSFQVIKGTPEQLGNGPGNPPPGGTHGIIELTENFVIDKELPYNFGFIFPDSWPEDAWLMELLDPPETVTLKLIANTEKYGDSFIIDDTDDSLGFHFCFYAPLNLDENGNPIVEGIPIPYQASWIGTDPNASSFGQISYEDGFHPVDPQLVPEPTSTLSLLALGTLGAASTLKRKLKPSQSTEKETTKVG